MRIVIVGQQEFGKSVLEAFEARGDRVVGVFCAPEKAGARPDPLREHAQGRGLPLFQLASLKGEDALAALRGLDADLGVMAYVLQFVPQDFTRAPRLGTIQYHPSLLPRYRGPSSINWPIIRGDSHTGLTIFRPTDGLDEGPVLMQKTVPIGPDDTLADVYFERLFPLGVQALLETADGLAQGRLLQSVQDETQASYEGWCRAAEAQIHWHSHVDQIYNLIRGCNPSPGAWTSVGGKRLQVFDARKHPVRTFGAVRGRPGECIGVDGGSLLVSAQGGLIELIRVRPDEGRKVAAAEWFAQSGLAAGVSLGS
jgi:methionyl-tRNA formyltransferase